MAEHNLFLLLACLPFATSLILLTLPPRARGASTWLSALSLAGVPAVRIHYEFFGPADELLAACASYQIGRAHV